MPSWFDACLDQCLDGMAGKVRLQAVTKTLKPVDILALPGTPFPMIPAPGVGKAIVPVGNSFYRYDAGTIAYTPGNADNIFALVRNGNPTVPFFVGNTLAGMVDALISAISGLADEGSVAPLTDLDNQGVDFTITGTTPGATGGNGTITVTIYYVVINLLQDS